MVLEGRVDVEDGNAVFSLELGLKLADSVLQ